MQKLAQISIGLGAVLAIGFHVFERLAGLILAAKAPVDHRQPQSIQGIAVGAA